MQCPSRLKEKRENPCICSIAKVDEVCSGDPKPNPDLTTSFQPWRCEGAIFFLFINLL